MTGDSAIDSCRICLGDKSDGHFISPCKCNGTMKYVHAHCLNTWRRSKPSAFYKCDLCHYPYLFQQPLIASMWNQQPIKLLITALCFIICSFIVGVCSSPILPKQLSFSSTTLITRCMHTIAAGSIIIGIIGAIILFVVILICSSDTSFMDELFINYESSNGVLIGIFIAIGIIIVLHLIYLIISEMIEYCANEYTIYENNTI